VELEGTPKNVRFVNGLRKLVGFLEVEQFGKEEEPEKEETEEERREGVE